MVGRYKKKENPILMFTWIHEKVFSNPIQFKRAPRIRKKHVQKEKEENLISIPRISEENKKRIQNLQRIISTSDMKMAFFVIEGLTQKKKDLHFFFFPGKSWWRFQVTDLLFTFA